MMRPDQATVDLDIDRPPSLRDHIYTTLRRAILSGSMSPGTTLVQEQLADQMGVSRTPIRDALDRLVSEGLLTRVTGGRIYVTELSLQELQEKYAVRQVLEGLALRLAVERMTEQHLAKLQQLLDQMQVAVEANNVDAATGLGHEFHVTIIAASGNTFLAQTLEALNDSIRRYRRVAANLPGRAADTLREHEAIFSAIVQGDVEGANRHMQEHIVKSQQQIEAAIQEYTLATPSGSRQAILTGLVNQAGK